MSTIFSRDGFAALRVAYGVAALSTAFAAGAVAASWFYWQAEKRSDLRSTVELKGASDRVANARRERDDMRDSEATYQTLSSRGVFVRESRMDLVETLESLRSRHHLSALEYEVKPQRPLKLSGQGAFPAIDVLSSRIRLQLRAPHDGHVVTFLDEFPRLQRGFFPIDRCVLRREGEATQKVQATASIGGKRAEQPNGVEAECTLEWITLLEKRPSATPPGGKK